ncbi:chorismate-binding protein [Porphyromonas pogonae]|uniref:chorismate-binding protein n=1 Tax=Porphyromonas pogonae TaxID=867595 RepID=UPI002E79F6E9|nr:chorismate-binding protein [Porphyromonas pogonae]
MSRLLSNFGRQFTLDNMLNSLEEILSGACAYACYKLPYKDSLHIITSENAPVTGNNLSDIDTFEGFVFAPFALTSQNPMLLLKGQEREIRIKDLPDTPLLCDIHNTDEAEEFASYQKDFSIFTQALLTDRYEKLVLARKHTVDVTRGFDVHNLFMTACRKYPEAFVYIFHAPATGTWLGATPEILFEKKADGTCRTVSLAGTVTHDTVSDWSPKNASEQAVVTDYIADTLTSLDIQFKKSQPYNFDTANLRHIKTDFIFTYPPSSPLHRLIQALYPTPAVCGLPKEASKEFILSNESIDRAYYSGFLGPKKNEDIAFYVNLRCMQADNEKKRVNFYAGGGLLKSSTFMDEWSETNNKMNTLVSLMK